MRPRIAIVGGGIAAGLAAYTLSPQNDLSLFRPARAKSSPIPEIVPRRKFFDTLQCCEAVEQEILQSARSDITEVIWHDPRGDRSRGLRSTEEFFVYDKARLAAWLLERATISRSDDLEVATISTLGGYDAVLDCRGAKAVAKDPAYRCEAPEAPRTRCRYLIADRPDILPRHQMRFWTERTGDAAMTYFMVPVGDKQMSLGCSSDPALAVDRARLLEAAARQGIVASQDSIVMTGDVMPMRQNFRSSLPHVTPLGDAQSQPCPLTEYGTMRALSHVVQLNRGAAPKPIPHKRPPATQPDPHIPAELFA